MQETPPSGAVRCGWRQYDLQLAAHYQRLANRYVRSTFAGTTLHHLCAATCSIISGMQTPGPRNMRVHPNDWAFRGSLVYGCQFSHFPRTQHITCLLPRTVPLLPAFSPVSIPPALLVGSSPRYLTCWLRGTGFLELTPCPVSRRQPASTFSSSSSVLKAPRHAARSLRPTELPPSLSLRG